MLHKLLLLLLVSLGPLATAQAAPPAAGSKSATKSKSATRAAENRAGTSATAPTVVEDIEPVHPGVFLLRDPLVQRELQLTPTQTTAAGELASEFNEAIWRFRDARIESPEAQREARLVNSKIEPRLRELLSPAQLSRLEGIGLQVQGASALGYVSTAQKLALTADQRRSIARIEAASRTTLQKLRTEASGTESAETSRLFEKRSREFQQDLQAVLTAGQRDRWRELAGAPLELRRLRPLTAEAPELRNVTAWINTEPFELRQLRGKVVVLHFWTFGCINCIHNYPSYKNWLEKFPTRDVVLVGVHAPETEGEKDIARIRDKAQENGLSFPIVVDNDLRNWQAWSNSIWPAVYVIDRQGLVRYWWYGELNWQGAKGEQFLGDKIRELLAEK
ncbi:MAG: redoxin domain-containing protein [Planctomycetes bacterium]|nr:redoxin domain-containing protein [Planctomycetota bacterium]